MPIMPTANSDGNGPNGSFPFIFAERSWPKVQGAPDHPNGLPRNSREGVPFHLAPMPLLALLIAALLLLAAPAAARAAGPEIGIADDRVLHVRYRVRR